MPVTQHGFETQIGPKHFGHFLLLTLLEAKVANQVSVCAEQGTQLQIVGEALT